MRNRLNSRGYSLIEVLVAFMILALALTVLLRIFSGGLSNISASADYARAVLVAEAQLAGAGIAGELSPGETTGEEAGRYRWSRKVTAYPLVGTTGIADQPVSAYQVTVTVEWPRGAQLRQVDLTSLRLAANESGG